MTSTARFSHRFVVRAPDQLDEGVLYVSLEYATALHLCACGCRSEVVTPLRPAQYSMTFDGESVSLRPSIGNWGFPCRSHYWIERGGLVRWARTWSDEEVTWARAGRETDPDERRVEAQDRGALARVARWFARRTSR